MTETALRQSSLGALATKDKACRVVCSGWLHLSRNGLSGPGKGRTYLIIMRDCSRASGGTLWGACIPVISVTVMIMGTEKHRTLTTSRRCRDAKKLHPGKEIPVR